ncbi:MAG TPA: BamA/TamA family outer membrane protein, partial [Candidatus Didemnitutus sp.]|nr:BamA/TamA family outer membrane protein [Candidatus Didemnitutus sp.]
LPPNEDTLSTYSVGPLLQWDTRDDQFYPTTGSFANFSAMFFGGDREYQTYRAEWNNYRSLGEDRVLGLRAFARTTGGDAPFYALSQFGMGSDLRGYTNGKYRDKAMFATQAEYRQFLTYRWGFVLFAGVGEVMPGFDQINWDNLLGSVGGGIRFRLSKENPVNMRFDWAYGKDGAATYLQVNEAF